jgi:hypothetical protein
MTPSDGIWAHGINGQPGEKSAIRTILAMLPRVFRHHHLIVPR